MFIFGHSPFFHGTPGRVVLQFVFDEPQLGYGDGQHRQVHGHEQHEQYEIYVKERRVFPRPPRPRGLGADDVQTQHDAEHEQNGRG